MIAHEATVKNLSRHILYSLTAICVFIVLACGGSGGGAKENLNGVYHCSYSRAVNGNVYLFVTDPNNVNVRVNDGTDEYKGTGTVANGHFSIVCPSGAKSITVVGDFFSLPSGRFQVVIHITGEFVAGGTATFDGLTGGDAFKGNYVGGNSGASTGTFTLQVAPNGHLTMSTQLFGETYNLTGELNGGYGSEILLDLPAPAGSLLVGTRFSYDATGRKHVEGGWLFSNRDGAGSNPVGFFSGDETLTP